MPAARGIWKLVSSKTDRTVLRDDLDPLRFQLFLDVLTEWTELTVQFRVGSADHANVDCSQNSD
jgi:hypothetical protein